MKTQEFFKEVADIKGLLTHASGMSKQKGYVELVKELYEREKVSEEGLRHLLSVWEIRNVLVRNAESSVHISDEEEKALLQAKQHLKV